MELNVITPASRTELLKTVNQYKNNFRFAAGASDLILELKRQDAKNTTVINLSHLNDKQFTEIEVLKTFIRIGALTTAETLAENKVIFKNFPVLVQAANELASAQIRHVATVGGNICTASPSGDLLCALVALKASCEILSTTGKTRILPISEFIIGLRKTDLKNNEVLRSIQIPANEKGNTLFSGFIKVGTRRSMECSVVSLSYHVQTGKSGKIKNAGIAVGAVAPNVPFAKKACDYLINKNKNKLTEDEQKIFASLVIGYANPITDVRASAWYRKEVLFNISKGLFETDKGGSAND